MQLMTTGAKRAFGYIRVSTERGAKGDSLDAQRREIELIAQLEGRELVAVFADPAISATIPLAKRPEGARLLEGLRPGDLAIASRLDRVFRDLEDAAATLKRLKAMNVGLYLRDLAGDATRDSTAELLFGIMASLGSWERRRFSERRASVRQTQREAGRYMGGAAPFGYLIVEREGKQYVEAIAEIHDASRRLHEQGYSARLAAGHFSGLGFPTTHKSVVQLWRTLGLRLTSAVAA